MEKTKEYWYLGILSAESTSITAVHLTKAEHKAVKKFLEQLESRGYSGSCSISNTKYESREELEAKVYTDF